MDATELGKLLQRHKALSDCQRVLVDRLGQTGRDLEVLGKALRELPHEVRVSDSSFVVSPRGAEHGVPRSALDADLLVEQLSDLEEKVRTLREIEGKG